MKKIAFLLVAMLLLSARPVHAYLDAGSGSMILQLLLGGVAGLAVILKLYWHQLLSILRLDKKKKVETDETTEE